MSANDNSGWEPEPDKRGTAKLLTSCILTLAVCAWSSLHLDIPTKSQRSRNLAIKLAWFCLAMFVPQALLIIALNQRLAAREIKNWVCELERDSGDPELRKSKPWVPWLRRCIGRGLRGDREAYEMVGSDKSNRRGRHRWGMTHGFYACMGGYVFDLSHDEEIEGATDGQPPDSSRQPIDAGSPPDPYQPMPPFLPFGLNRVVITRHGVTFLLEHFPDIFPNISEISITDRSKADGLAKAFLVGQVAWFCLNIIARVGQDLPLSLLELATVPRAVTALLVYAMWWEKPVDISLPTVLCGKTAREACALMAVLTQLSAFKITDNGYIAEAALLIAGSNAQSQRSAMNGQTSPILGTLRSSNEVDANTYPTLPSTSSTSSSFTIRPGAGRMLAAEKSTKYDNIWYRGPSMGTAHQMSPSDWERWRLASSALARIQLRGSGGMLGLQMDKAGDLMSLNPHGRDLIMGRSSLIDYIWSGGGNIWGMVHQGFSLIYLSFYGLFFSILEVQNRRASLAEDYWPRLEILDIISAYASFGLLFPIPPLILVFVLELVAKKSKYRSLNSVERMQHNDHWYPRALRLCHLLLILSLLVFIPCSVLIVLPAFAFLRDESRKVYIQADWTKAIPHF